MYLIAISSIRNATEVDIYENVYGRHEETSWNKSTMHFGVNWANFSVVCVPCGVRIAPSFIEDP